jgi:hypothetical protein
VVTPHELIVGEMLDVVTDNPMKQYSKLIACIYARAREDGISPQEVAEQMFKLMPNTDVWNAMRPSLEEDLLLRARAMIHDLDPTFVPAWLEAA